MDKDSLAIIALIALEIGLFFLPAQVKPKSDLEKKNIVTTAQHSPIHWGYEGTVGPEFWGDISDDYKTCGVGQTQTPINIDTSMTKKITTKDFVFSYKNSPLTVVNNGHTIQVTYAPGSYVTYQGNQYELVQFHFHVPSEHTINGKSWPMNVHFVHKDKNGKLLVIEVLFNEGTENAELAKIMSVASHKEETVTKDDMTVDARKLLPANIAYYHYDGSLTTPPCTEGVSWFVMKSSIEVAQRDIGAFKEIFPFNARPVQPLNGRIVEEY